MSKKPFSIPASNQARNSTIQRLGLDDKEVDFIAADMALGLACQDNCQSRGDLVDFALTKGLAPYLPLFLQRRGWLDDDWQQRLEALSTIFQRQVN